MSPLPLKHLSGMLTAMKKSNMLAFYLLAAEAFFERKCREGPFVERVSGKCLGQWRTLKLTLFSVS